MTDVSFWQPGKLYQPDDLVQSNEVGAVGQSALTNADFELGDVGWTKDAEFSIGVGSSFEGTQRARFSGEEIGKFVILGDNSGIETSYATGDGSSFITGSPQGNLLAASDHTFIAVRKDTTTPASYHSDDGLTWSAGETIWGVLDEDKAFLAWDEFTSQFILGEAGDRSYYLSPDSGSPYWVKYEMPLTYTATATMVALFHYSGRTYIVNDAGEIHSSPDLEDWYYQGTVSLNVHTVIQVDDIYAMLGYSGSSYRFATTKDPRKQADIWLRNTDAEASLDSALGLSAATKTSLAHYNGTTVVLQHESTDAATTDRLATSTDLTTWTAQSSRAGAWIRWSSVLRKFVSTVGGLAASDAKLNLSTDGASWSQQTYQAGAGYAEFATADLLIDPPERVCTNDDRKVTTAGQVVVASAKVMTSLGSTAKVGIAWYDSGGSLLSVTYDDDGAVEGASDEWRGAAIRAIGVADAATCSVVLNGYGADEILFDDVKWDHYTQTELENFIFKAVQADAGFSDAAEPVWPTVLGNTVVDNEVTWEAINANRVVWEAKPHLLSGSVEPTWPTEEDATVVDNTILWVAESGRVRDPNCPNTKAVAIEANKVFAVDDDIIPFCATTNPLDWSSEDDAGFLPFGLNTHGSQPATALGLYRSNLVAFNSKGFQMWQVDEDPQNMALLDAVPVGCPYYKSLAPVSNDLVFLTEVGIRNLGIAGASTNLQAGVFGKQVDPLIKEAIKGGEEPLALFYPGAGQYWLFFGEEAFVLTVNGGSSDMSWSRYEFPSAIDDWTIDGVDLLLRSGDKVWRVDEDILRDDEGGDDVEFTGRMWWPYLDFGSLGQDKAMIGFDTVADGQYDVAFGYDQSDDALVTADYTIVEGDTVVGDIVPFELNAPSIQMRLTFAGNQAWEWSASTLYLQDQRKG